MKKALYILAIIAIISLLGIFLFQNNDQTFEREYEYLGPNSNSPFNPNIE